jgi:Uma2 family endonuclease
MMPAKAADRALLTASWETYERLLSEHAGSPGTRLASCDGMIEVTAVRVGHECPNRTLASLVNIVVEETDVDCLKPGVRRSNGQISAREPNLIPLSTLVTSPS